MLRTLFVDIYQIKKGVRGASLWWGESIDGGVSDIKETGNHSGLMGRLTKPGLATLTNTYPRLSICNAGYQ
jgi:hypothetical protein